MIVDWDKDAGDEAYAIAVKTRSYASLVGEIYEMMNEFGKSGVPKYDVACPLTNSINVCYSPETSLKGFFCFDNVRLYVAHIAETNNDYELDAALKIAAQRCLG